MKTSLIPLLLFIITLTGCDEIVVPFPNSTFDSPFPKNKRDLSKLLGEHLTIKSGEDTLFLDIIGNRKTNYIIERQNNDTLFSGTVSRFRGLYYLSAQLNDTSYWIYALKVRGNLVYGLNTAFQQVYAVEQAIKNGNNKKMVRYINADTTFIRLHPERQEMKKLYTTILNSLVPDTILNYEPDFLAMEGNNNSTVTEIDPEEFNFIVNAYPNPSKDILNIELRQKGSASFRLSRMDGKIMLQGQLNETLNKINISSQHTGVYALTIINSADQQQETIKVVKAE